MDAFTIAILAAASSGFVTLAITLEEFIRARLKRPSSQNKDGEVRVTIQMGDNVIEFGARDEATANNLLAKWLEINRESVIKAGEATERDTVE